MSPVVSANSSASENKQSLALDWQECTEWLTRCQHYAHQKKFPFNLIETLPTSWNDDSSNPEENAVLHLISILRDGVLLCQLLAVLSDNQVDPKNEKDFCTRTQNSPFLWGQNIHLFLRMCRGAPFLLKPQQLFDPADLFEARNFGKVLNTLSCLSKTDVAQKTGIKDFPSANHQLKANHEYYNTLEDLAGQSSTLSRQTYVFTNHIDTTSQGSGDEYDIEQETIYDTIVQKGDKQKVVIVPVGDTTLPHATKRDHCIHELLNTEKNFVEVLRIILEEYKKPLNKYLSPQEIDTIFRFIDKLHEIHRDFMGDLNLALNPTNRTLITLPEAMSRFAPNLLIYGEYCGHIDQAQSLLVDLLANEGEKKAALSHCQQRSKESKFGLKDLLMVPMQRVLKYHLLLQTLLKATSEEHSDYIALQEALEKMRTVANYINEVKRDLETIEIVDKIQSKIEDINWPDGKKLTDYGRRVKDGELKLANNSMGNSCKTRHVFLFDRMLLLCKPKKDSYEFKEAVHVNNSRVTLSADQASKRLEKWSFGFVYEVLSSCQKEGSGKYYLFAKTYDIRSEWIQAFELAQENNCPSGAKSNGYHFEMYTFDSPTYCSICHKLLLGAFYQGYRCRDSKTVAHKACITKAPARLMAHPNESLSPEPQFIDPSQGASVHRSGSGTWEQSPNVTPQFASLARSERFPQQNMSPNSPSWTSLRTSRTSSLANHGIARSTTAYNGSSPPLSLNYRPPLTFPQNVTIELLVKDDPDWWKGRYNRQEGWFPASSVVECRKVASSSPPRSMSDSTDSPTLSRSPSTVSVDNQPWFVGVMDRVRATSSLLGKPNGTFLVRLSENNTRLHEYTISVMYDTPKHLRIYRIHEATVQYYLHESRKFSSVTELISHFSRHHLGSIFPGVDTTLRYPVNLSRIQSTNAPYNQFSRAPSTMTINSGGGNNNNNNTASNGASGSVFQAVAIHEFKAHHDRHLALRPGDVVSVLAQEWDGRGWWKGSLQGRVGFFPKECVQRCNE